MNKVMPVSLLTTLGLIATMVPASSAEAAVQPLPTDRQTIRTQLKTNPENTDAEITAAFAAYDKGDSSLLEAMPYKVVLELKPVATGTQMAALAATCPDASHSYWVKMSSNNIFGVELLWSRYDVKWTSNCASLVGGIPSEKVDGDVTGSALMQWAVVRSGHPGPVTNFAPPPTSYFFSWNGSPFGGWHHDQTIRFQSVNAGESDINHEMHVNILGSNRVCVSFKDGTGLQCGQY